MNQDQYPYTAFFKLFHAAGVQISFGIGAQDPDEHLCKLDAYMSTLLDSGYSVQAPGLEPGEEIESVDAYVRGETSKGDPCLYLYSANHSLQWRIATVYVERFDDMPFSVAGAKLWEADAAPARESAERKGVLNAVPTFEIVLEPTGKLTEAGNPILRYARVRGGSARPAVATPEPEPDNPFLDPDPELERRRDRMHALGTELYGARWEAVRHANVRKLTEGRTESSNDLSLEEVNKLIRGLETLEREQRKAQMRATG